MFWRKKTNGLLPPKSIPEAVGRYMVVSQGQNPDWVWNLKAVLRPNAESKDSFDVRVFEPSKVAGLGIKIKDYNSLNEHPELIVFEGWFNKRTYTVKFEKKPNPG